MKPLFTILGLGLLLTFSSCLIGGDDGPVGPQGPRGADGRDGADGPQGEPGEEAFVFEYEGVSFTGPDYEVVLGYATDFTALTSDVTLVYFLWGEDEVDGEVVEVWRPLPQNVITESGLLQYNFDWTIYDVKLFLDADFPLDQLTAIDTDNWIVRIVVVPGQFWSGGRMEMPSYDEVKARYGLSELNVNHVIPKRRSL